MNPEYAALAQLAYDAVIAVMVANESKHPDAEWKTQDVDDHLRHAMTHAWDALDHHDGLAQFMPNTRREDILSAGTRIFMALQVYQAGAGQ